MPSNPISTAQPKIIPYAHEETINIDTAVGVLSFKLIIGCSKHENNEFDELFPRIKLAELNNKSKSSNTHLDERFAIDPLTIKTLSIKNYSIVHLQHEC
jgi:hypothetical protein